MTRKKGRISLWSLTLMVALALVGTGAASAAWTETAVDLSVTRISTGEKVNSTLNALILDDETLYVPIDTIFGANGLAARAGIAWVIRDGQVYVRSGTGVKSVPFEVVDGQLYVPALEALGAIGMTAGLGNMNHLMVTYW